MTSFDAILIGGGHNALACAAHLAQRGWKVGVFERNAVCGGAVRTEELTLPGYRHDLGAMNLNLFAGSAFYRAYREKLVAAGLAFAPAKDCFASVFADDKWFGVSSDLNRNLSRLANLSHRDAEQWRRLAERFPKDSGPLLRLLGSPMTAWGLAATAWAIWRAKGVRGSLEMLRFLLSSSREWLDQTFESPEVRATMAAWGMHLDFAPDIPGGAIFPYLESMASQAFGLVSGKGGADTMIKAMETLITSAGGVIRTNADVATISVSGNRATGVVLASGEQVTASKVVIAGVTPSALLGLLGGSSGDAGFDQAMGKFRHAPGTLMVHLATKELPNWRASEELRRFAYVHIAPSLDQMARVYQQAVAGIMPAEPVLVVGQATAIDPGRAPEGNHILWIQVRMLPKIIEGDEAGTIDSRDWRLAKEAYADRVVAIIEKHAPGLTESIMARAVFSPLDLQAMNVNLVGGDGLGGSHHLAQNFLFRPAAGRANGSTPVRNLHLVGASVWPGAGVGAGSGFLLAQNLAGK
ncbi:NAD(P)/FAD-dependent oxidoreductase [Mesorhizobium sp. M8A.F.Ca.ET.173.01.1.1]|nr:NAD(P)/FAD-dependent oxidoreductase [Mesorhizobium sp. M8A.F.Ca.ET.173.01.1.1]